MIPNDLEHLHNQATREISQEELLNIIEKDKNISKHFVKDKVKKYIFIKNKLLNIIT